MLKALINQAKEVPHIPMTKEEKNKFYWSPEWRSMSKHILNRDHHECQVCKSQGKVTLTNLLVHHIKPLEFYPKLRLTESNLLTVCLSCHNTIHGLTSTEWDDEWW